ncbi:choice-of-anchor A family protein [Kitasatospora sp. NPDC092948]|uniref:choice-of-anchor A family protein n=1 Tax=Kitasatospora sp. NPDC092948 TaxID=3364088 RepID=UPI003805C329
MRKSISAAAVALGGSLALAALVVPTPATAAPGEGTCLSLGVAGKYGEFIEGDDTHSPDAEGAVAIGGNADFSRGGFTVGNELTAAEVAALPGGHALVIGGNLIQKGAHVQVMKGKGVVAGQVVGGGQLEGVAKGASPIDFAAEFAKLRALSAELAKTAGAAPVADGRKLTFTGADAKANVFTVSADTLQKANEIYLKVPAGSSTVITVTGGSYDQTKAPTSSFWIWDNAKKTYVLDDKLQSADGGAERAKLLWNFPAATKIVKHSGNAWPGSILAPNAAFDLGRGGPVNGSVWAKSLTGSGGAETHHYPFSGCLPGTTVPPTSPSGTPSPSASPSTGTGGSESPSPSSSASTPGGTESPGPSDSAGPSESAPAGATPSPSASHGGPGGGGHGGGLAFTGAEGLVPLTIGGAAVLGAGGALVYKARRKKAAASS